MSNTESESNDRYIQRKADWSEWYIDSDNQISFRASANNHIIFSYKILEAPQFDTMQSEAFSYFLDQQKAFIEGVNTLFFNSKEFFHATIEYRITNNVDGEKIGFYIIIRVVSAYVFNPEDVTIIKQNFEKILPNGYELLSLKSEILSNLLTLDQKEIVTEVRKCPVFLPAGKHFSSQDNWFIPPLLGEVNPKTRIYLPCTDYINNEKSTWTNFFKIIKSYSKPVKIRISLCSTPVSETERSLAFKYFNLLSENYKDALEIKDIALDSYLKSLLKFAGATKLYSLKFQVASSDKSDSVYIASALSNHLSSGRAHMTMNCFDLPQAGRQEWTNCDQVYFDEKPDIKSRPYCTDEVSLFIKRIQYLYDTNEVLTALRLPAGVGEKLPGLVIRLPIPFYQTNFIKNNKDAINLGNISSTASMIKIRANETSNFENKTAYAIPVKDLTKHGLIVGSTGSGKTNTTLNFIKGLVEKNIPFLLIEPVKSEYYSQLSKMFKGKKINRFNLKMPFNEDGTINLEYLRFNPFIPYSGISVAQHVSYIKTCFTAAFPMHNILPLLLEEAIRSLFSDEYEDYSYGIPRDQHFLPDKSPRYIYDNIDVSQKEREKHSYLTIDSLFNIVSETVKDTFPDPKDQAEYAAVLARRIRRLKDDTLGHCLNPPKWGKNIIPNNIETILSQPTIIELEDLADNQDKALIMAFLLTYLYEKAQMKESTTNVDHITIIEEAHRLLSNSNNNIPSGEDNVSKDSSSTSISLFIDMLAEIRAKGEGIFIVEQIPRKLVDDVIKNTNLKIMHRLTSQDDRDAMGDAMNMTDAQRNYVNTLKTGAAIVYDEKLDNPLYIKVNKYEKPT